MLTNFHHLQIIVSKGIVKKNVYGVNKDIIYLKINVN